MEQLATISLPVSKPPVGQLAELAAGNYTDIVTIYGPAEAAYGETVNIQVVIKNLYSTAIYIAASGRRDGVDFSFSPDWPSVNAGGIYTFTASFSMPDKDIRLDVWSFYWTGTAPAEDDHEYVVIKRAAAVWEKLATKGITLTPEVAVWEKLATQSITLTPVAIVWEKLATKGITLTPVAIVWEKLATKGITLTPVAVVWEKLATQSITLTPVAAVWEKLATQSITVTPEEIPPEEELLEETIYPYAYIYDGDTEDSVFTFQSDPFTPAKWIAGKVSAKLEEEVKKQGGRVLEFRVYVDQSPLLWNDWRIEVVSTPLKATEGVATAIGIAIWAVIILAVLAIALIIIITWAIKTVVSAFTHKPISEEIKKAWSRETLISAINDFEEKLERTPTPPEELEEKSDQELRDYCDELAEEVAPPPSIGALGIALAAVGVVGLGGLGLVAAFAGRPMELTAGK